MKGAAQKVVFVSGMPSHYVRRMHVEVERYLCGNACFIYVQDATTATQRRYERGDYPSACHTVPASGYRAIWRHVKDASPALVVMHGHYPRPLLVVTALLLLHRIPFAYWSDTNAAEIARRSWLARVTQLFFGRLVLGRAKALLYVGSVNRMFYETVLPKSRLARIHFQRMPYPHLSDQFETNSGRTPRSRRVRLLYVGRLSSEKNVSELLRVLKMLPPELNGHWECNIVGDGPERDALEDQARLLQLQECVFFAGAIDSNRVAAEFAAADIFVLLSTREPWGLVVNEAMSSGLAVVASTAAGATFDLVHDGVTGFRVDPTDTARCAEILAKLVSDPVLCRKLGANAAAFVRDGQWSLEGAIAGFCLMAKKLQLIVRP